MYVIYIHHVLNIAEPERWNTEHVACYNVYIYQHMYICIHNICMSYIYTYTAYMYVIYIHHVLDIAKPERWNVENVACDHMYTYQYMYTHKHHICMSCICTSCIICCETRAPEYRARRLSSYVYIYINTCTHVYIIYVCHVYVHQVLPVVKPECQNAKHIAFYHMCIH